MSKGSSVRRPFAVLAFSAGLSLALLARSPAGAAAPPPPPPRADVEAILSRSPGPPPADRLKELKVLLLANEKDHGLEEHDYPLWQKRWTVLLGGKEAGEARQVNLYGPAPREGGEEALAGAAGVKVRTAWVWPKKEDFEWAGLIVAFTGTGRTWSRERVEDLERFLERGGGFAAIHSAVIANKELAGPLAERIGLAWQDGTTTFRHGPVDLAVRALDHPICLGLPSGVHFEDESYWPLVGDREKIDLLATADEAVKTAGGGTAEAPQPMLWTFQRGKGRAFSCILGHYTWTFDDPYARILLLRGMAWAARESPFRFDPLVLRGARVRDEAAPAAAARASVAPRPPEAKDPRLLLWLDASDRGTLTVDADGGISGWSSKAGPGGRGLSSSLTQRPLWVKDGPGGRPAARFDGKDDVLRNTGFRRSAKDWTLFLVAGVRSNQGFFRALFSASKTGVNDYLSGINLDLGGVGSGSIDTLNLEGIQHPGQSNLKAESEPFGAMVIAVARGAGRATAWIDGVEEGSRDSGDVPASLEEIRIGARSFQNPPGTLPLVEAGFLDGDIAEVVLFGVALGPEEREGISSYLEGKYGVARARFAEPTLDEAFEALRAFEIGKGRRTLGPIDAAILASHGDGAATAAIEERLLAVLSAGVTRDAKDFVARRLLRIGTRRCVSALAALLPDEGLSHLARSALERIAGPEAAAALRDAIPRLREKSKAGAIDSLGRIADTGFTEVLAAILEDGDPACASAAAGALARVGAAEPLLAFRAKADGPPAEAACQALADLAYRLLEAGRKDDAARIFKELSGGGSESIRIQALRGFARAAPADARPLLDRASKSESRRLRAAAARILEEMDASAKAPAKG